jgi:hypothetical protein
MVILSFRPAASSADTNGARLFLAGAVLIEIATMSAFSSLVDETNLSIGAFFAYVYASESCLFE